MVVPPSQSREGVSYTAFVCKMQLREDTVDNVVHMSPVDNSEFDNHSQFYTWNIPTNCRDLPDPVGDAGCDTDSGSDCTALSEILVNGGPYN